MEQEAGKRKGIFYDGKFIDISGVIYSSIIQFLFSINDSKNIKNTPYKIIYKEY